MSHSFGSIDFLTTFRKNQASLKSKAGSKYVIRQSLNVLFLWQIFSLLTSSQTDLSLGGGTFSEDAAQNFWAFGIFIPNLGVGE